MEVIYKVWRLYIEYGGYLKDLEVIYEVWRFRKFSGIVRSIVCGNVRSQL